MITIPVTAEHITRAIDEIEEGADICAFCPVALAFTDFFGFPIRVNGRSAYCFPESCVQHVWYLPLDTVDRIALFDRTKQIDPFTIEIESAHPEIFDARYDDYGETF